jgi:hypothetical protein
MALEVVGEVEDGLVKNFPLAEQEGDEKAADAAISVEERVDGLELDVGEADLDQLRKVGRGMEELFKIAEELRNILGRRGDEGGVVQRAASRANPVLGATQFAGSESSAANALEELFVDLPDQADRQREFLEALQAVVHGRDVVDHLIDVAGRVRGQNLGFGGEKILEGALGPFDLAGEHGLLADVHEDEKVRIGKCLDGSIQSTQSPVRLRE